MTEPTMRILSLGAGVQSTTIALMACDGALPGLDAAIFADTGWEPAAVYQQVDRIAAELQRAHIDFFRVSKGNLRADAINPDGRFAAVPYFVRNPDGSQGMGRRQCTSEYKLGPIMRACRQLLGAKPPNYRTVPRGKTVEQWIGFSTDEIHRVNDQLANRYTTKRYPLLELGMSRKDCRRYRSMLPLDIAPIDRIERKEYRDLQLDMFEDGDSEGCSPYGCRSGEAVS